MKINEADVVLLKDGREATVIDKHSESVFLVEVPAGEEYESFFVKITEIEKVTWRYHPNQ